MLKLYFTRVQVSSELAEWITQWIQTDLFLYWRPTWGLCVRIEETCSILMASEWCRLEPTADHTVSTSTSGSSSPRARRRRNGEPVCHRGGIGRSSHRRLGHVVASGASPSVCRARRPLWRHRPLLASLLGMRLALVSGHSGTVEWTLGVLRGVLDLMDCPTARTACELRLLAIIFH